jgi:hypothetical protein
MNVTDEIIKLKEQLDSGAISAEEFETRKTQLIDAESSKTPSPVTTETIRQQGQPAKRLRNGIGNAGFVVALLLVICYWIPVLILIIGEYSIDMSMALMLNKFLGFMSTYGWIVWGIGLVLSIVGLVRARAGRSKGCAAVGLILSIAHVIGFIILVIGIANSALNMFL